MRLQSDTLATSLAEERARAESIALEAERRKIEATRAAIGAAELRLRAEDEARTLARAHSQTRAELSQLRGHLAAVWTRRLGRLGAERLWRMALAGGGAALAAIAIIGYVATRSDAPSASTEFSAPALKLERELRTAPHEQAPR